MIGSAGGTFEIPCGATHLYLGFHDGYQWNNNAGSVAGYYRFIYPENLIGVDNPVTVWATACLFFAYAPAGAVGPWGEAVENYRPMTIPIPPAAIAVQLFGFDGSWTFNQGSGDTYYGPDGGDPFVTTNSGYMSPAYNSQNLSTINAGSGALVGMFGIQC